MKGGVTTKHKKKHEKSEGTWYFYGIPLTIETLLTSLFIIAVFIALGVLSDAIVLIKNNFWVSCSLTFLTLSVFVYLLIKGQESSDKDYEIANLKQEIKKFEDMHERDNQIIESLLEKLEKAQHTSHQD